jgi:hypothetical protein
LAGVWFRVSAGAKTGAAKPAPGGRVNGRRTRTEPNGTGGTGLAAEQTGAMPPADENGARRMRIERRFTKDGQSPYAGIAFRLTTSEIRNPDGSVVFRLENVEVPDFWSQVASDVLAQKYFRKAGVPARLKTVEENSVPSFLWRQVADHAALSLLPEAERYVGEHSSKQVFDRLAGTWT